MKNNFFENLSEHISDNAILKREDVPESMRWDLSHIFKDQKEYTSEFTKFKKNCQKISSFSGKLSESAETLISALKEEERLERQILKLYIYSHLKSDEDCSNTENEAEKQKILAAYADFAAKSAFIRPEISNISEKKLEDFFKTCQELELYRHYIYEIRRLKKHTLSQKEEAIISGFSEVLAAPEQIFSVFSDSDIKFDDAIDKDGKKSVLTQTKFVPILESKDRVLRKSAFENFYKTMRQFSNTFSRMLSSQVILQNRNAKIRGYASALSAALSENDIPEKVYDQLLDQVERHLPLLHRYTNLRKKILGVSELFAYDLYVPLTKINEHFTFDEAKSITLEALKPMGNDYITVVKNAFEERWIDVLPNSGKRGGAYSSGSYDTKPYILLNWQGRLDDLFTLVHELGHSLHSYLTRKTQPYIYGDYSIFLAEIASTCNENLLTFYLLENEKDVIKRAALLNHYLDGFKGTVFRQTQFAEFEKEIHEMEASGRSLTSDILSEIYGKINEKYYGPALESGEGTSYEWTRIPHFYYNFYVYQYATGFSAATAFSSRIYKRQEGALEAYLEFLKSGSSARPLDVLTKAGLDMTNPEPVCDAMKSFEEALIEFEKII